MSDLIQATTSGVKDMADNTLRVSFDIDPRYAMQAFALFGKRGSSVAIAALNLQASQAVAQQETIEADKPKGGLLSQWLALRCKEQDFWGFIAKKSYGAVFSEADCDRAVKLFLGITSKSELDNDKEAADRFHNMIRLPYAAWLAGAR